MKISLLNVNFPYRRITSTVLRGSPLSSPSQKYSAQNNLYARSTFWGGKSCHSRQLHKLPERVAWRITAALRKICGTPKTQDILNQLLSSLILNVFSFLCHYFTRSDGCHYTLCLIQYMGYNKWELFKMSPATSTKACQTLNHHQTA